MAVEVADVADQLALQITVVGGQVTIRAGHSTKLKFSILHGDSYSSWLFKLWDIILRSMFLAY